MRRLWRAAAIIGSILVTLGALAVDIGLRRAVDLPIPVTVAPLLLGAVTLAAAWPAANILYRSWGFELTDDWIQARWGILFRRTVTIPRNRVQTLTSENGPVDRLLGLTSVTVHTAGVGTPDLSIPHLADETVEWLRGELARGPR